MAPKAIGLKLDNLTEKSKIKISKTQKEGEG